MMTRVQRSILFAFVVTGWTNAARAVELTPPPVAKPATVWVGYAVSPTGRVFSEKSAEEERARVFAQDECERATGLSCRAIAVTKAWKVSAVQCGGAGFIAGVVVGSPFPIAQRKAIQAGVRAPCRQVFAR